MKHYHFTITVSNEGHEFYVEDYSCQAKSLKDAKEQATIRENKIIEALMYVMPSGSWDADAERRE